MDSQVAPESGQRHVTAREQILYATVGRRKQVRGGKKRERGRIYSSKPIVVTST